MDHGDIRNRLDQERRNLVRAGTQVEVLPEVTRVHYGGPQHLIEYSDLTSENADMVIQREIAHYESLGLDFEWKCFGHDLPLDLLARLKRYGFEIGEREAVMVAEVALALNWDASAPHLRVVRVRSAEELAAFQRLAGEVFGRDYAATVAQLQENLVSGSVEHLGYLGFVGGQLAGVGRLYTHPSSQFAGLYGGGTLPAYRGRGCYRALVLARALDAAAFGARYLLVDALPTSRPILERLGFVHLIDTWPCSWRSLSQVE